MTNIQPQFGSVWTYSPNSMDSAQKIQNHLQAQLKNEAACGMTVLAKGNTKPTVNVAVEDRFDATVKKALTQIIDQGLMSIYPVNGEPFLNTGSLPEAKDVKFWDKVSREVASNWKSLPAFPIQTVENWSQNIGKKPAQD